MIRQAVAGAAMGVIPVASIEVVRDPNRAYVNADIAFGRSNCTCDVDRGHPGWFGALAFEEMMLELSGEDYVVDVVGREVRALRRIWMDQVEFDSSQFPWGQILPCVKPPLTRRFRMISDAIACNRLAEALELAEDAMVELCSMVRPARMDGRNKMVRSG
jgi:hypothetical protein